MFQDIRNNSIFLFSIVNRKRIYIYYIIHLDFSNNQLIVQYNREITCKLKIIHIFSLFIKVYNIYILKSRNVSSGENLEKCIKCNDTKSEKQQRRSHG